MAFKYSLHETFPEIEQGCDNLLSATSQMVEAKAELDHHLGSIREIDQVVENITTSLTALKNADDPNEVISILNMDGSVESLLGVADGKITAKAAMEGFTDALKKAWETIKKWALQAWEFIKKYVGRIWTWFTGLFNKSKKLASDVKRLSPDQRTVFGNTTVNSLNGKSATEAMTADTAKQYPFVSYENFRTELDYYRSFLENSIKRLESFTNSSVNDKLDSIGLSIYDLLKEYLKDPSGEKPRMALQRLKDNAKYEYDHQVHNNEVLWLTMFKMAFDYETGAWSLVWTGPAGAEAADKSDEPLSSLGWTPENINKNVEMISKLQKEFKILCDKFEAAKKAAFARASEIEPDLWTARAGLSNSGEYDLTESKQAVVSITKYLQTWLVTQYTHMSSLFVHMTKFIDLHENKLSIAAKNAMAS